MLAEPLVVPMEHAYYSGNEKNGTILVHCYDYNRKKSCEPCLEEQL